MKNVRLLLIISVLLMVSFVGCSRIQTIEEKAELSEEPVKEISRKEAIIEFQNCRIVPQLGNHWDYTFEPGKFPGFEWDRPCFVEKVMGDFPLEARWFDGELNEVNTPEQPGRYAFYVEGKTPKGEIIRRASTVYCRPKYWLGWSEKPKAHLDFLALDGIDRPMWAEHEDAIAAFAGRIVLYSILRQEQGAVLLPDFPVSGDKVITLRHCFTHTTGLFGHEEWGGLHNPWLENVISNGLDYLEPGKVHNYNGMGYDLAGKVMEIVSGKSIFRLMRENLFDPLELKDTTLEEDLGFSCFSTAGDFARFGQLLLNKGSYGELKFFSPQTFDRILPKPLKTYYPAIDNEWGIGLTWMRQKHPDAGKNDVPEDATVLSKNVIGHGSATSAILRVDLDNDLVISQSRRRAGKAYGKNLDKFLLAIDEGLK